MRSTHEGCVDATGAGPPLGLVDAFGRVATDLRVSVTDRCNLRCTYCMPADGLTWLPREQHLSDKEVCRLLVMAIEVLGIREVRFTGGEPLLRRGLETMVHCAVAAGARVSVTTNGVGLRARAATLARAGLSRINVSLDTLSDDRYAAITRRRRLHETIDGLAAAAEAGLQPVKVNAVLQRGVNDDEAADLLAFCLDRGYELRFIEQMPLDPMHIWDRRQLVTAGEILGQLRERWVLTPDPAERAGAPAETWLVDGGPARVGVIASVTRPFCADCNRTRLTADGHVRNCLFAREETDLRTPLRAGATDAELAELWRAAMARKQPGHGIGGDTFTQPARPMSAIGG
ncbi:MAG: GTP 3',8-cyclase MoaA [Actinomycetes bacterium]